MKTCKACAVEKGRLLPPLDNMRKGARREFLL